MAELSVQATQKGDSALNNLQRAALGLPKAGVGLGKTISSVFTLNASGVTDGLRQTVEGLTDIPAGLVCAVADGATMYFSLTPDEVKNVKSPLEQALEKQK